MKITWEDKNGINYLCFNSNNWINSFGEYGPLNLNELFKSIYSDSIKQAINNTRTIPFLKLLDKSNETI